MILSSNPVSELEIETSSLLLFFEWLTGFYDGTPHTVGLNAAVPFPSLKAKDWTADKPTWNIRFQQSHLDQPLDGLGMTVVWSAPSIARVEWEEVNGVTQQVAYTKVLLMFWVRCAVPASVAGNATLQVRDCSEKLFALLQNPAATRGLKQKGIHRLRPGTPQAITETNYAVRCVTCRATLRYPILSQT